MCCDKNTHHKDGTEATYQRSHVALCTSRLSGQRTERAAEDVASAVGVLELGFRLVLDLSLIHI